MRKKHNRGIIKQILKEHFSGFWEIHSGLYPKSLKLNIEETVEKAIKCGAADIGYAKYECLGCTGKPEPVFVCFTCKSRFCHRCGKKYTDEWAEKQVENILNVSHRHLVFTIPQELRNIFFNDRKRLNQLSKKVAEVIQYWYKNKNKKRELEVGVITVIHTFGRDLKWNPHIHALITEGAIDKYKEWKAVNYIPYEYLRKSWQKLLCELIKKWYSSEPKTRELINDLYQRYPKGFYVNAERKMSNAKGAAKYIGRYLARPAIAEYRIVEYNGKEGHFWYEDQAGKRIDVKMTVYKFLYLLLQHIPPKHFRMVGRYGLYSRQKKQTITKNRKYMELFSNKTTGNVIYAKEEKNIL